MPASDLIPVLFLTLLLLACGESPPREEPKLLAGDWHMELDLPDVDLPFNFTLGPGAYHEWEMIIHNGAESIRINDLTIVGDSIFIRMPLYDSEFRGLIRSKDRISGHWHDHSRGPGYKIPFSAKAGEFPRFGPQEGIPADLSGTWAVHFSPETPKGYKAIGVLDQHTDGTATGTFITETGDHRYLEGVVQGDSLKLSAFDGSHAHLYIASSNGDSLSGKFWSGIHWQEAWIAHRDPGVSLRDPDSLTFLKNGHTTIDLTFPDLQGNLVSLTDQRFRNKPVIIQVMGSWCPNCIDETHLLNELHTKYSGQGLEVIALAFEKYDDPARAIQALERFKKTLNIEYPILYAGKADKASAAEKLPFLDRVMSYPTCIYLDHTGAVRRIRTGYYGPGTGEHHTRFRNEVEGFVQRLISERAADLAPLR